MTIAMRTSPLATRKIASGICPACGLELTRQPVSSRRTATEKDHHAVARCRRPECSAGDVCYLVYLTGDDHTLAPTVTAVAVR